MPSLSSSSLLPNNKTKIVSYGGTNNSNDADGVEDDQPLLGSATTCNTAVDDDNIFKDLLYYGGSSRNDIGSKTHPTRTPIKRFKRHRNYYIWCLNEFRHWWKTSRLLVRLSGGYVFCHNNYKAVVTATTTVAAAMGGTGGAIGGVGDTASVTTSNNAWYSLITTSLTKTKGKMKYKDHSRHAFKMMKTIGRGGVSKDFLNNVRPVSRKNYRMSWMFALLRPIET